MARALAVLAVVPAAVYGLNYGADTWRSGGSDCGSCMWDANCRAGCGGTLVNGVSCAASAKAWCGLAWSWNQCKHTCTHFGQAPANQKGWHCVPNVPGHTTVAACNEAIRCPGPVADGRCLHCGGTCAQMFKAHHAAERTEERANLPGIPEIPEGDETAVKEEVVSAGKAPQTWSSAFFFFALGAVAMFVMTYVHQNSRKAAPEAPEALEAASESYGTVA